MKNKQAKRHQVLKLAAISALTLVVTACSTASTGIDYPVPSSPPAEKEQTSRIIDSPQSNYLENSSLDKLADAINAEAANDNSTNTESTSSAKSESITKHQGTGSADSIWLTDKPALLHLSVGDGEELVKELYGNGHDSYTLSDEAGSIMVYEYDGFAVGMNDSNKVQFVELFGSDIQSGLGGLLIGDTLDRALHTLGKPDTQTDYMLTYMAEGAFLKLDLDPALGEVISIKLIMR